MMTDEQQDALVGRIIRESKEAEAELQRLLALADNYARDIKKLSEEIAARVGRARRVGTESSIPGARVYDPPVARIEPDAGIEHLRDYAAIVDLEAIGTLDEAIGIAVAKAQKLRQQKRSLGI